MGLKEFYYSLEDKYYDFVEKTGLYKITDKIDKIMPSFLFFILLILIIIAALFLLIPKGAGADQYTLSFIVKDAGTGDILPGVPVSITTDNDVFTLISNDDGTTDDVYAGKNSDFTVDIDYTIADYKRFTKSYTADEDGQKITLLLEPVFQLQTTKYRFSVLNSNNQRITNSGVVSFRCAGGEGTAPRDADIISGQVEVDVDPNCNLLATIVTNGYQTQYDYPVMNGGVVTLQQTSASLSSAGTYSLTAYARSSAGNVLSNIKITAYNNLGVQIGFCTTSTGGTCIITGLDAGTYDVRAVDNSSVPIYNMSTASVLVNANTTQTFIMSTNVAGYIKVLVKKASNNQPVANALVKLKSQDIELFSDYTDSNGMKLFTVSNISQSYRVVADVNGYLIASVNATPSTTVPSSANVVVSLTAVTPNTIAPLSVQVVGADGQPYRFSKVVLYDADNGFLTDYEPETTDYNGMVTFSASSGNYYAMAMKGSTTGRSTDFTFDVRTSAVFQTVIVPMSISTGTLRVTVVNKDGEPVPNARVDIYDKLNASEPVKSDVTDVQGEKIFEVDADEEIFVVASDPMNEDYGASQSKLVNILPNVTNNLEVTLYEKLSSLSKPEIVFNGLYKGDSKITGNVSAGEEYEARFVLLIPSDRSGDGDFDEVGAIIRTSSGESVYLENDSLYIKYIDVPGASNIERYTQYSPEGEYDDKDDEDSITTGDSKWAMVVFEKQDFAGIDDDYLTAYEITAKVKVRDTAVFGEKLDIYYLGYGYNEDDEYETDPVYDGSNDEVAYMSYNQDTYSIGDEVACSDNFCFSSYIIDQDDDMRYNASTSFAASPGKSYKFHFTLVNNNLDRIYTQARLLVKNLDEGLDFAKIELALPNGDTTTVNAQSNTHEFDIPLVNLEANNKLEGDIYFDTMLIGTRHLLLNFVSDQEVEFVNDLAMSVQSDKKFKIEITPNVIPSGKTFNIQVKARDESTDLQVDDAIVTVKDRYLTTLKTSEPVGVDGEVSVIGIPAQNDGDSVFVYVQAPEYETYVAELEATENIYSINPGKISASLNINNDRSKTATFTISNLSQIDLVIDSMTVIGDEDNLEIIDVQRMNNALASYEGVTLKGIDPESINNLDSRKDIEVRVDVNPRAEGITEVQNISATVKIALKDTQMPINVWEIEVPLTVTVGFDGLLDSTTCMTLSDGSWNAVVLDKSVDKKLQLSNGCMMGGKTVPLMGGLEAKVQFDSNPMGRFVINVGNKVVELSHGYFRTVFDSVDKEAIYPVTIRYEPVGRFTGEVTGKIVLRSINQTSSGEQTITTELPFTLNVVSLADCYSLSKNILTIYNQPDTFTIENAGCGAATTYRLSCDDCKGLIVNPLENIRVEATGVSNPIQVSSVGAMPGQYLLNIYSKIDGARGSEKNVGKIKVVVRPVGQCLDLDRYEFDLYRSQYSENTGNLLNATAYDTANLVNTCFKQTVQVEGKVKNSARFQMALLTGLRDGLFTGVGSALIQKKNIDLWPFGDSTSWLPSWLGGSKEATTTPPATSSVETPEIDKPSTSNESTATDGSNAGNNNTQTNGDDSSTNVNSVSASNNSNSNQPQSTIAEPIMAPTILGYIAGQSAVNNNTSVYLQSSTTDAEIYWRKAANDSWYKSNEVIVDFGTDNSATEFSFQAKCVKDGVDSEEVTFTYKNFDSVLPSSSSVPPQSSGTGIVSGSGTYVIYQAIDSGTSITCTGNFPIEPVGDPYWYRCVGSGKYQPCKNNVALGVLDVSDAPSSHDVKNCS